MCPGGLRHPLPFMASSLFLGQVLDNNPRSGQKSNLGNQHFTDELPCASHYGLGVSCMLFHGVLVE